jgi:alkaline phosphatase D
MPREPDAYRLNLPGGESVATELVVPSVTSDNLDDIAGTRPRTSSVAVEAAFQQANPHVKLLEMDSHGYAVLEITAERLRMDWWYVADRDDPTAAQAHGQAWMVEAGSRRVTPVS